MSTGHRWCSPCRYSSKPVNGDWHTLADHLLGTAERAAVFGRPLGLGDAAWWAGLWHDVGKGSCVFQDYLAVASREGSGVARSRYPKRDHERAGASLAIEAGLPEAAFAVLGHHSGIPSLDDVRNDRLLRQVDDGLFTSVEAALGRPIRPDSKISLPPAETTLDREMLTRFLTSCLVDADYLDTEAHFSGERAEGQSIGPVIERFRDNLARTVAGAPDTPVNRVRSEWAKHVKERAAAAGPGIYRLSGRTGIGKTLGGMDAVFAHLERNDMGRVVVATPYMSVTDQTAGVIRSMCDPLEGPPAVLEHHSGTSDDITGWGRLAAENWDARWL